MTTGALVTMVLILGIVVGGFAGFLTLAMRQESRRADAHDEADDA